MKSDEVCACACIPHIYKHTDMPHIQTYIHLCVCTRRWHVATEAMSTLNLTCRRGLAPICSSVRLSTSSVRPSLSGALKLLIWFSFKCGLRTPSPYHPFPSPYACVFVCVCVCEITCILSRCARLGVGTTVSSYSARLCWLHWTWAAASASAAAAAARAATLLPGHTLRSNERASTHLN